MFSTSLQNSFMRRWSTGRRGTRMEWWKKIALVWHPPSLSLFKGSLSLKITLSQTATWMCTHVYLSSVRCGVGLPVLIGQRHLFYVHRANVGLGHRQQQHRHTDRTAGREPVTAVQRHTVACLIGSTLLNTNQISTISHPCFSYFHHPPFSDFLVLFLSCVSVLFF